MAKVEKSRDVGEGGGYKIVVIRTGITVSFNLSHHLSKSVEYNMYKLHLMVAYVATIM